MPDLFTSQAWWLRQLAALELPSDSVTRLSRWRGVRFRYRSRTVGSSSRLSSSRATIRHHITTCSSVAHPLQPLCGPCGRRASFATLLQQGQRHHQAALFPEHQRWLGHSSRPTALRASRFAMDKCIVAIAVAFALATASHQHPCFETDHKTLHGCCFVARTATAVYARQSS